jgi:hypothetical protein
MVGHPRPHPPQMRVPSARREPPIGPLRLPRSLLLGCSDLQLPESLLLPRSRHLLLVLVVQSLKKGLLSVLGGQSALQIKRTIKYVK